MLEQHRLVAQRDARIRQPPQRSAHLRRQLTRMIRVNADEERMKLLQHCAQFRRDALRQEDGNARADAQKLHMRNRPQPREQILQLLVAEQQRVAPAQQHVANLRMRRDVGELLVELRMKIIAAGIAHQARARAVAAIARAPIRHEEEHAVGITMHQPRHWRMPVLAAGITQFPRRRGRLLDARNDLPPDGAILIRRIDEIEEVGRDAQVIDLPAHQRLAGGRLLLAADVRMRPAPASCSCLLLCLRFSLSV